MTIQELVKPAGIHTYRELAAKSGLSLQACWLLWTGRRLPGAHVARAIAKATGIEVGKVLLAKPNGRGRRKTNSRHAAAQKP